MKTLIEDVRYGLRMLRKSPGFTVLAILTLALGIGANTAIFSIVNSVLLKPLPYKDPGRLVLVFEGIPKAGLATLPFSAPDLEEFERQNQVLEGIAAFQNRRYELSGVDRPERIVGARASASLFQVLGVQPALGRAFTREEDQEGRAVVVLNYGLWQRKFGGDPGIVGKSVPLDRQPYTVVGVMPSGFEFPRRGPIFNNEPAELWVPIAFTPFERQAWGMMFNNSVIARLKPGITLERARAEAKSTVGRIQKIYPPVIQSAPSFALTAAVVPFREEVVGRTRTALLVLLGAVGLVLLIACADVASLLLTRAAARQREMAIRTALGAARLRLVRQMLTESLLLAIGGGALGLVVALWGNDLLVALAPGNILAFEGSRIDGRALGFTLLLCLATALLFGLAPAMEVSRRDVGEALKESSRSSTPGRRQRRLLGGIVTLQFAMALVLLVGAGLLVRSFARLMATDPGFRPEHVLSMSVSLPANAYAKADQIRSFYQRLIERVESLPGVRAVGVASDVPLSVRERRAFTAEGRSMASSGTPPTVATVWPLGNYFEALGIPLKKGRFFTSQDRQGSGLVVLINETMARRFWPGEDAVGKRIKWGVPQSFSPWMTIVGVVGDIKQGPLHTETIPQTYQPYLQVPDPSVENNITGLLRSLTLVLRVEGDPNALVAAAREQVRTLDAALPVANVQAMQDVIRQSVSPQRFSMFLLAVFAGAALVLAAIGIYGVLAYSVTQQRHEIGVRLALGATESHVLRLVAGQGMKFVGVGMALGLAASLALTRVLRSLLYEIGPYDPWTFAGVGLLLAAVAFFACYWPARRAAKVDPMVALRYE